MQGGLHGFGVELRGVFGFMARAGLAVGFNDAARLADAGVPDAKPYHSRRDRQVFIAIDDLGYSHLGQLVKFADLPLRVTGPPPS